MSTVWKRLCPGALALILAVAGCRVDGTVAVKKDRPTTAAKPTATAKPATPKGLARLQRPAGEVTSLKGIVSIDASYLVAAGGGNIVAAGAGNIVAAGGLNLIGADGASLVGPDGASLIGNNGNTIVAAGGGNVIAEGGLRLIGNNGNTLVGPDGASLVGPDGASLVGPDGASLVGPDGASYRLAQGAAGTPTPSAPAPATGTVLPAAVMRVGLLDLRTGQPIPIGLDAAGKPVLTIYTDLQGRYELFVPADFTRYVRVIAEAPEKVDQRLAYDVVARPGGPDDPIDEDTAQIGRFLRGVFVSRLEDLMTKRADVLVKELEPARTMSADSPGETAPPDDGFFAKLVRPALVKFSEMSYRQGFDLMTTPALRARRRAIAQRAADIILADCTFEEVLSTYYTVPQYVAPPGETAVEAFGKSLRSIREGIAPQIDPTKPEIFATTLQRLAELPDAPAEAYRLRRPSDFNTFLIDHFLTTRVNNKGIGPGSDTERLQKVQGLLKTLGLLTKEDESGRLFAAGRAIGTHMLEVFFYKGRTEEAEYAPGGQAVVDYLESVKTGVERPAGATPPDTEGSPL